MTPPSIPQSRQRRRRYRQWNLITAMSRRRRSSGRPFSLFFFAFFRQEFFCLFLFQTRAPGLPNKRGRNVRNIFPVSKATVTGLAPEEEATEWIGVKPLRGGTLAGVSFGWRQLSSSTTTTKPFLTTPPRLVEWSDSTSTAMSVSLISAFEFRSQRRPRTGI